MSAVIATTKNEERPKAPLWWRIARGTVRGTATVARIVYIESRYTYGVAKTRTRARYKAWKAERNFTVDDMPEIDEVPRKRRRLGRTQYVCMACSRKYRSAHGLNKHYGNVHANEQPQQASQTKIKGFSAITNKVRVTGRRDRSTRPAITPSSTRSANPMNSVIAQALKAAWARLAEHRPYLLSEIRDDMVGLEQVLGGSAGEAIDAYRAHLVRNVGFNPDTVRKLNKVKALLEEAGKEASGVIAAIEDFYAADIAAARKRKGGTQPSDRTLTN